MSSTTVTSKAQAPITRLDSKGFTVLLCRPCSYQGYDSILNRIKNWRHGLIVEGKCRKCGQMHEYNAPQARMTG